MVKMMKRTSAFLMAFIMCFVLLGNSVCPAVAVLYEDANRVIPTSKLSVESEGAKWTVGFTYTDTVGATHTIDVGDTFARLMVNGENACCMMLGTQVRGGDTYVPNGGLFQIWESFSDVQQKYLGLVMAFGKPNLDREHYYATQFVLWEITCGFRSCDENFVTTRIIRDCVDLSSTGVHVPSVNTIYSQIINSIRTWYKTPSGMTEDVLKPTEYNMVFNPVTNNWECTVNVANGVLNTFNLLRSNTNYTITKKTANSFTIAAPMNCTSDCKVTASKIIPAYDESITTEGLVVWYESGKQALVTGASFDPVYAYANFNIPGTVPLTLTKEFYSGSTQITSSNVSTIADGASMADLYSAIRFSITATDADGNTYNVIKKTGEGNGTYSFSKFSTTETSNYTVNNSNGKLSFTGLPKGYTYTVTETATYSSGSINFRLAGSKTLTPSSDATALTTTIRNNLIPNIQTDAIEVVKKLYTPDGAEITDTAFIEDYLNNISFYLYTLDNSGNKQYLILGNFSDGRYAGYIKQDTATNTTNYDTNYMTANRSSATEIKVAAVGDASIAQGQADFQNMPSFPNGLYLEEVIGEKYINGWYAPNTYSTSVNGAVIQLVSAGEMNDSYYEIDNMQKTFKAVVYKTDVNYTPEYNESPMSQYINGGQFGLYNSADELLTSGTCVNGVIVFDSVVYDVDETYYIQEIEAPEGYVLDTTKHNLTFTDNDYKAAIGVRTITLTNKAVYGNINIEKTDSTTGTALAGATFAIYANDDILIENQVVFAAGEPIKEMSLDESGAFVVGTEDYVVTTDAEGKASFSYLPIGYYEIVETDVPEGYVLNDSVVSVAVTSKGDASTVGYRNILHPVQNTMQGGVLHVYKTDGETETPLAGAEFTVYAAEDFVVGGVTVHAKDEVICVLTTDENGYASNLLDAESVEVGEQTYYPMYVGAKYYMVETAAPEGYVIDSTAEYFEFEYLDASIQYSELTLGEINNIQKGTLKVYKTDGLTQTPLAGAEFDVVVAEDFVVGGVTILTKDTVVSSIVTGEDGYATTDSDLYVGATYYLIETKAPEGYLPNNEKINFSLTYDVNVEYTEAEQSVINQRQQGSLTIYKTDGETSVALEGAEFDIVVAEDFVVGGVTILTKGDVVCSVITDANGKANTGNILYVGAKYYLTETKAPEGYVLDETQIPFEVGYDVDIEYSEVEISVENSEETTTGTPTPEIPTTPDTPNTNITTDSSPETGVYHDTTILLTLGVFLAAVNVILFSRKRKTN